jgi:hypothetical protein
MQLKAQSPEKRLVQAIVLRGYLLCLLEVLQRMRKTPRFEVKTHRLPQKKGDPITRSKAIATRLERRFCYISVAS